jgi:transposase-like protein
MSLSYIKTQLQGLYDADISESLISKITDAVVDEVKAWQNRALEAVNPIVFFDCLVVKVRHEKRIIALGIDLSSRKDIFGL